MPINNPTGDFFNPPSNLSQDFEEYYFDYLYLFVTFSTYF